MVSFNLAVKRGYRNKNGEVGTDFIRCVGFRRIADNLVTYKDTGNYIEVEGSLTKRNYFVDGKENYVVEVHLTNINFPQIGEGKGVNNHAGTKTKPPEEMEDIKVDEDDLPF